MYVEFDTLPGSSKVWIYQASGLMNDQQVETIFNEAKVFIETWTAHQAELKASVAMFLNLFLVIAVDESFNDASGCSIDKKVHFVKHLEQKTGLNFFDRMKVAYLDGTSIQIASMNHFAALLQTNKISEDTLIFNNLVANLDEFRSSWKIPIKNSWLASLI